MTDLTGRKVLITGAATGIGAATARAMTARAAQVTALDRRPGPLAKLGKSVGAHTVVADVAAPDATTAAVDEAARHMGGLTDVVVNAGMGLNKPLHLYTDDEWRLVMAVNLDGAFHTIRAAIPHLLDNEAASVVTVASLNATRPLPGEGPYSAAKAGLVNLTRTVAVEYAPTIRANCVSPGMIATDLTALITEDPELTTVTEAGTPLGHIGSPDEVADVIAFLCSHDARYVTGQELIVDGGAALPNLQADAVVRAIRDRFSPGE